MRPDAFESGGRFIPAVQKVRLLHASIRHHLRREGLWDEAALGVPTCQEDMIGSLMGFSIQVLDALHRLGIRMTASEAEAYYYAWRVAGIMLGCDPDVVPADTESARAFSDFYFVRHLGPSPEGARLTRQLIDLYEGVVPGKLLDPIVPALIRYLVGDTVADWLEVPRSHWDTMVKLVPVMLGTWESVEQSGPVGRWVMEHVGTLASNLELTALTSGRVMQYAIPEHLKDEYDVKRMAAGDDRWTPPPVTLPGSLQLFLHNDALHPFGAAHRDGQHPQPAAGLADDRHQPVAPPARGRGHPEDGGIPGRNDAHRVLRARPVPAAGGAPGHPGGQRPGGQPGADQQPHHDRGGRRVAYRRDHHRARLVRLPGGGEYRADPRVGRLVTVAERGDPDGHEPAPHREGKYRDQPHHQRQPLVLNWRNTTERAIIGIIMTVPIGSAVAGSGTISAPALADLLGRWSVAEGPLYRLLSARLARLADTGALTPGLRLPAERDLAAQLSVSRNTVAMAYQTLRDDGMAESRQGSGTRIVPHRTTPAATHRANGFFTNLLESSPVRADLTFAQGECAPQVAGALADPSSVLSRAKLGAITRGHGYYPLGFPELRAAIATMLTTRYGVPTTADEVMVTSGAQQALDLLARDEILPGSAAIVEEPTFAGMIDILHRAGARLVGLPPGDGDDILERLLDAHAPALVYLVPTHHNPLGLIMPEQVRRRVVRLASRHPGTTFIDDMALTDLELTDAQRPPPLAALAPRQPNIVTVGSLSKSYWGGLRIGWVRAPAGVIARLGAVKAVADLGCPPLGQAAAAALISEQHDDIVKWRQGWLRTRYDALTGALAEQLPSWRWPRPDGGSAIWVRIPSGEDAFTQAALRAGVAVLPGRLLTIGSKSSGHLRLAFTADPAILVDAVRTLATVPGAAGGLR